MIDAIATRIPTTLTAALVVSILMPVVISTEVAENLPVPVVISAEDAEIVPNRRKATGRRWIDMNYGPFLTAALQVDKGNIAHSNIVHKGIAIRIDGSEGGITSGQRFVVFDTDTLRYAAGWEGPSFVDWKSIVWDGSHQTHSSIVGHELFQNPPGPGWAKPGTQSRK